MEDKILKSGDRFKTSEGNQYDFSVGLTHFLFVSVEFSNNFINVGFENAIKHYGNIPLRDLIEILEYILFHKKSLGTVYEK